MKKLLVVAGALALTVTPLSATAQLDPSSKPNKEGYLTYDGDTFGGRDCKTGKFRRHETSGKVTSRYKFCTFFYRYDPTKDNNANRDFGAVWFATRVQPQNDWCAKQVKSKLGVQTSGTGKVHNRAPKGTRLGATESRTVKTSLVVDANGGGSGTGRLQKKWTLLPKGMKISKFKKDGFTNLLLDWEGKTKKTTSFASAVEISWQQGGAPPSIFPEVRALHVKPC